MDIIIRYKEKEMEINENWAYVEMFGKVRYCKVVKTPRAKSLDKEHCFARSRGEVCYIERQEDWYGWHHFDNKVAVAVSRDGWQDFFIS
tara:strand:+ start:4229 stop:4495 length:267 start_codon:yes stop_codon:yes gene_type:complete